MCLRDRISYWSCGPEPSVDCALHTLTSSLLDVLGFQLVGTVTDDDEHMVVR